MTNKLLYYASLEKHMNSYMDQVKQTELNEQFQLAQNKIVREGELMNLSQADIMNKLKQLQEDLKNQVAQSIITPLSKTNAPELVKQEEKYTPMTSNQYESIINKKPTIKVENRRGLIDELDKKLKSRKKNDVETLSKIAKNESERDTKKTIKTLFQQELEAKLKNRSDTSSQATTASTTSSATSPKSFTKLHPAQATAQLRAEFTAKGKDWPYGKGNVSYANMIKAREQLGQGLKKKSKKIYVNI
jgi:hypothetical protein